MTTRHACALLLAYAVSVCGCNVDDCSSLENHLRASFEEKRVALEMLRKMSEEDKSVIRIAPAFTRLETDWSWPRSGEKLGFTEARWNEYLRLFSEAGLPEGLERGSNSIMFMTKACGLGISGKSFGYAFIPQKPAATFKTFDDLRERRGLRANSRELVLVCFGDLIASLLHG